jgi:hypothetical protein
MNNLLMGKLFPRLIAKAGGPYPVLRNLILRRATAATCASSCWHPTHLRYPPSCALRVRINC